MKYREANSWGAYYWWEKRGRVIQTHCDLCPEVISHPHFGTAHRLMEAHLINQHRETCKSSLLTTPLDRETMKKLAPEASDSEFPF